MAQLNAIMADDTKRQASYDAGHERIRFCGYCHGEDGNSKREYIPNLASQHPLYLFNQFEQFRDGSREDYVMSQLAKTLSLEERINIAVYYSQQTANPRAGSDGKLSEAGGKLFAERCASCHGEDAQGFRDMPRLAGQPAEYLRIALRRFKGMDPVKHSTPMIGIAGVLTAGEIEALAGYLAGR
ncbi:c-type cytochrome [Marinobacter daepoensis]|nr:c-type cytochrome [Marinobacter daepoensis]